MPQKNILIYAFCLVLLNSSFSRQLNPMFTIICFPIVNYLKDKFLDVKYEIAMNFTP